MTDTPAAYLRTSLEDFNRAHGLADQSQSISNQRKVILEYVQHNPEFSEVQIREFIDDGLTGTNTDRPQFQAMIEAARRGEVKWILPFAISCTKITAEIFPSRSVPQCTPA